MASPGDSALPQALLLEVEPWWCLSQSLVPRSKPLEGRGAMLLLFGWWTPQAVSDASRASACDHGWWGQGHSATEPVCRGDRGRRLHEHDVHGMRTRGGAHLHYRAGTPNQQAWSLEKRD